MDHSPNLAEEAAESFNPEDQGLPVSDHSESLEVRVMPLLSQIKLC